MKIKVIPELKDWPVELLNTYYNNPVIIEWDYPVLPRIGETVDLWGLFEGQIGKCPSEDYFAKVRDIAWIRVNDGKGELVPEISISNDI
jgi:hypothetical protein